MYNIGDEVTIGFKTGNGYTSIRSGKIEMVDGMSYSLNEGLEYPIYVHFDSIVKHKPNNPNSTWNYLHPKASSPPLIDQVNHPKHYNSHPSGIECIDVVRHMSFNLGNVIKYLWRADHKDATIEDLKKARFYLDDEIKRLSKSEVVKLELDTGLVEIPKVVTHPLKVD